MKRYILGRLARAIVAILAVVSIAILMIYTMIPKEKIFDNDSTLTKLANKPDERTTYMFTKWEDMGYLVFNRQSEMCEASSDNYQACMTNGSEEHEKMVAAYEEKGYTIKTFESGMVYSFREYEPFEFITNFLTSFIVLDNPYAVKDLSNPNLERKVYVANDFNGVPAVKCSGCENEYLLYFDSNFPFIHQNFISLSFGKSYPTFSGIDTMEVISSGQGAYDTKKTTFETGVTADSYINLHGCKYKPTDSLDRIDTNKFNTNYANCASNLKSPSMINLSYLLGVSAIILAYIIAIPAGIAMAKSKGKLVDKMGMVYINFMIAVPSLAFIFFAKQIGVAFGLPDKFPILGFTDIRSYILPVIILSLLSTAGIMIWVRRYMVDQSSADYVKFARAKGLSQNEIFQKHILKNAIIPIVNGIPAQIILAISGSVITETVFSIPGMGKMLPDSIKIMNNSMVITLTFIFTSLSIISILIGDILLTVIDPRISLNAKGDTR